MQRRTFAWIALLAAITAAGALAADITGKWTGESTGPDGNSFTLNFDFKQNGTKLTGTVQGPEGDPIEISDGKVEGDKLSFTVHLDFNGGMTIHHDGVIKGDEITLSTKAEGGDFPNHPMTLKRAK